MSPVFQITLEVQVVYMELEPGLVVPFPVLFQNL